MPVGSVTRRWSQTAVNCQSMSTRSGAGGWHRRRCEIWSLNCSYAPARNRFACSGICQQASTTTRAGCSNCRPQRPICYQRNSRAPAHCARLGVPPILKSLSGTRQRWCMVNMARRVRKEKDKSERHTRRQKERQVKWVTGQGRRAEIDATIFMPRIGAWSGAWCMIGGRGSW